MADDPADRLVARAIESVLDQVPGAVDSGAGEASSAKLQPWAETAAPVGRNKRPLEELLADLEERVAGAPGARANLPRGRHPGLTFFDRFGRGGSGRGAAETGGDGEVRKRRRRRGSGGGGGSGTVAGAQPVGAVAAPPPGQPEKPAGTGGRRRSRRGRGGGGDRGAAPRHAAPAGEATARGGPGQPGLPRPQAGEGAQQGGTGQPVRPGGAGRRRRGRRGRGAGPAAAG